MQPAEQALMYSCRREWMSLEEAHSDCLLFEMHPFCETKKRAILTTALQARPPMRRIATGPRMFGDWNERTVDSNELLENIHCIQGSKLQL
jgi:hypothetical protein